MLQFCVYNIILLRDQKLLLRVDFFFICFSNTFMKMFRCAFNLSLVLCGICTQVLREFNHVNPQDDEEGKVFANTRVSLVCFVFSNF